MAEGAVNRKLAAILCADVAGYSRLSEEREEETHRAVAAALARLTADVEEHGGRVLGVAGDGALAEFPSALAALDCAVAFQRSQAARNAGAPPGDRLDFRIGINLGDVIVDGDDLFGSGVNLASRLEGLAEPGGICLSRKVMEEVRGRRDLDCAFAGAQKVKNIAEPVETYRVRVASPGAAPPPARPGRSPAFLAAAGILLAAVAAGGIAAYSLTRPSPPAATATSAGEARPAIAVLPFRNMMGDPGQDYFSEGITADLITDLSKVSGLRVVGRLAGRDEAGAEGAADAEVGYLLEGSVRRAGERLRINVQLVSAGGGDQLWAERYDRHLTDVFALQDEVVREIARALAVALRPEERTRLQNAARVNPEAYDLLLRGLELYRRSSPETNAEARVYFRRAAALDPDFARAHADIALTYVADILYGWVEQPGAVATEALAIAQEALKLDPDVPEVHFALSIIYRSLRRLDDAIAAARRAVEIDPDFADGHAVLATALNYAGRPRKALAELATARRLNPSPPFFYDWIEGQAHYLLGDLEAARTRFEQARGRNADFVPAHKMLAATYARLGMHEEAAWEVAEIEVRLPDFSLAQERAASPYADDAVFDDYVAALKEAGLSY